MNDLGQDVKFDICAAAAAEIVNLLGAEAPGDESRLYGIVLLLILCAVDEAQQCVSAPRFKVSNN